MWIELGLLALAIPVGLLIAWLAKEELKDGRKWFILICEVSVFLTTLFLFIDMNYLAWTFGFIFISTGMSLIKFK